MYISSNSNSKIKNIIQLQTKASARKKQKLFAVEGLRICNEVPRELIEEIYVSESFAKAEDKLMKELSGACTQEICIVADNVFKSISDTMNPQGIMAIVKQNCMDTITVNKDKKVTILILDSVRDPGNMGTIIRTAEGAGIDAIVMNSECVDIYNPKVTRSTMGSIFRVPIYISNNLCDTINFLKKEGVTMYAAHLKGDEYYNSEGFADSIGIMIGNEANGLSDEVSSLADKLVRIPMSGKLESLNAAVSAALLMYEARKAKGK